MSFLTPQDIQTFEDRPADVNTAHTGCYFGTNCLFTH